jgi:STE24 endopeptidase
VKSFWLAVAALLALFALSGSAIAEPANSRELPAGLQVPEAARPGPSFDVDRATESYLALLTPEQRAQSDAYFEGGYWLQLWGFLYGVGVSALVLASGWSRRMRDLARRIGHGPWRSSAIYVIFWFIVAAVLGAPWSVYEGFIREHQYGLATQDFAGWLGDQLKGLGVGIVLGAPVIALVYAAVRRAGDRWWVWAGGITFVFSLFLDLIAPVYISPLFNDYKPVPDGPVREAVLSLARANNIPTDHVVWFDASRQTTRVSANVSGFLGTTQVSLNDNLLNRSSLPEVKAVMGHEMGHYVLNHGLRLTIYLTLVITLGFYLADRGMNAGLARYGARFGIENRADPAGLPMFIAIFSSVLLLATPVLNSIVRQAEAEADQFGLNAAREPHGFATAAMRLSTYRKIHPGPLEEIVFYDHPSGYDRVHMSMVWLKENMEAPDVRASAASAAP